MSTDDLEHALAFAAANEHSGDLRACFAQAKAACRTLAAEIARLKLQADEDVIDARDAAWNLYAKRVTKRRAATIWPWLAEYEAAEKARQK